MSIDPGTQSVGRSEMINCMRGVDSDGRDGAWLGERCECIPANKAGNHRQEQNDTARGKCVRSPSVREGSHARRALAYARASDTPSRPAHAEIRMHLAALEFWRANQQGHQL